jgi:hypothetical protein
MSKKVFVLVRTGFGTQEIKIKEVDFLGQAPKSISIPGWDGKKHRIFAEPDTLAPISTVPFAYSLTRDGAEELRNRHVQHEIDSYSAAAKLAQSQADKWTEYMKGL